MPQHACGDCKVAVARVTTRFEDVHASAQTESPGRPGDRLVSNPALIIVNDWCGRNVHLIWNICGSLSLLRLVILWEIMIYTMHEDTVSRSLSLWNLQTWMAMVSNFAVIPKVWYYNTCTNIFLLKPKDGCVITAHIHIDTFLLCLQYHITQRQNDLSVFKMTGS